MKKSFLSLLFSFVFSFCFFHSDLSWAQENEETPVLEFSGRFLSKQTSAGQSNTLFLDIEVPPTFYAYVDAFKFRWTEPSALNLVSYEIQPNKNFHDPFTKKNRLVIQDKAQLTGIVDFPATMASGSYLGSLEISFQICSKKFCYFPMKKSININFEVLNNNANPITTKKIDPSSAEGIESKLNEGIFSTLIFVFLAGFLTSLTPCVFPMIPITLAVLSGNKNNKPARIRKSLIYVFGIALTYSILGIVAASTGALFGNALSHPAVIAVLALVFVAMAISMLGFFHFQTPSFIQNLQHNKYFKQHSDISAFISGLLAGVVASPCVGPVLVGILSFVAKSQNIKLGFALLFTFALGFGLLFIFLAFFEDAKKIFPKSGPWMEFTKILFAGIMFSFALFYVQSIVSFILFSSLISLASLVLIFASVKIMKEYQLQKSFFWQFVLLKLIGIFAISTIQSVYGENRFIHKWLQEYSAQALIWQNYNEKLLQEAKNQKPIIIDFTADWCLACTELKTRTFTDSKIRDLQDQFVFLQFDATRSSDLLENLKAKYKVIGLPTILFLDQNLNEITDLRLTGFEDANAFLARMKKAIESNAKNCAKPSDLNNMTCAQ